MKEMESWDSLIDRAKAIALVRRFSRFREELAEIRRRQAADMYLETIGIRLDEVKRGVQKT